MPKIVIDGKEIEAREGQSVLEAAAEHGIEIPHFCFHPRLKVAGNCRMCLVELEKVPKLQIACGTKVAEGMVVHTRSERVMRARRAVMEFLLLQHPLDCPICDQCGECKLQDYCFTYGPEKSRYDFPRRRFERMNIGPDLVRDMNRCIRCTRCIRFLRDVAGDEAFCLSERGPKTEVGTYLEKPVMNDFSLNLAEVCPVGALTSRHFRFKGRPWLLEQVRTLCPGCSRGCNVVAWHDGSRILRLTPAANEHVNLEWLCNPGRLTIEREQDKLRLHAESPSDALAEAVRFLKKTDGSKVAVVVSGRLTNEDIYVIAKFARQVLGTRLIAAVETESDERPFGPSERPLQEWFIRADKQPNSRGAAEILSAGDHVSAEELAAAIS
ncbi:MAG: NADH-quinone oxidoreductase subunit G, partial [Deltaproteobacteria bacterium]